VQTIIEKGGNIFAEELFNPSSVILVLVFPRNLFLRAVISVGVHQLISPFQYLTFVVSGVPPEDTSPISFIFLTSQLLGIKPTEVFLYARSIFIYFIIYHNLILFY